MNNKNIWGCLCECGKEAFDYFDEHPWCEDQSLVKYVKCSNCGKVHEINCSKAEEFYNKKIFECFKDIYGNVLEIGCGGGLVTEYVAGLESVKYLATVDVDDESISSISSKHHKLDLNNFDEGVFENTFDFVICRDVLMYLDDIDYTFSKLSKISNKVILLNWHDVNHRKDRKSVV